MCLFSKMGVYTFIMDTDKQKSAELRKELNKLKRQKKSLESQLKATKSELKQEKASSKKKRTLTVTKEQEQLISNMSKDINILNLLFD